MILEEKIITELELFKVIHIFLAVLAFSVITVAALEAILIAIQEKLLHQKTPSKNLKRLPPLESMENLLFQTVFVGFLLLTAVLISSIVFFGNIFTPDLLPKTILTMLAWITFGVLLVCRWWLGWRGYQALRWTLTGFLCLFAVLFTIYF